MRRFALTFVTLLTLVTPLSFRPADAAVMVVLTPPVDAPVIDPFRLPNGPYRSGNRGIEYDTEAGDLVRAAAAGVVSYAGVVARTSHVTIDHGGGLLSSYSFLHRVLVSRGDVVGQGDRVGVAASTFHFGVRIHGQYVDPAPLMGTMVVDVRLVQRPDRRRGFATAPSRFRTERRALLSLVRLDDPPVASIWRGGRFPLHGP